MAYSIIDLAGSGGQTNFSFTSPYLSRVDMHVYIDGVETTAFTFASDFIIVLNVALPGAATVRIRRITPITLPVVDFVNGAVLGETDLDFAGLQLLYAVQEAADDQVNSIHLQTGFSDRWNALGYRILNVGTPVATTDAVTKAYVDAISAAAGNVPTVIGQALKFLRVNAGATTHEWITLVKSMISDATAKGLALLGAADAAAVRTEAGITATGSAIVTAATEAAARVALGITTKGSEVATAADAAAVRTAAGLTSTGSSLVTAADSTAARVVINAQRQATVVMQRQDNVGAWKVYDPTGAEVNIGSSTTDGLQEAITYACNNAYDLDVRGGGIQVIGTGALGTNPFATTNTSTLVTVTHTAHGLATTDRVSYLGSSAVNGIPAAELNTGLNVTVVNANSYTITVVTAATSTGSGGGSAVTFTTARDASVINCTTGIVFPAIQNKTIRIGACTVNFTSAVTGTGVFFDSCMMTDLEWNGQIVYTGNADAVLFKPTNKVPYDATATVVDSKFKFNHIAIVGGTNPTGLRLDSTNGPILGCLFESFEINATDVAGTSGLVLGDATNGILTNVFHITRIHLCRTVAIAIGTSTTNQNNIYGNIFEGHVYGSTSGCTDGIDVYGDENVFTGVIVNNEGALTTGIHWRAGAGSNYFIVPRNNATTAITNDSGGATNKVNFV